MRVQLIVTIAAVFMGTFAIGASPVAAAQGLIINNGSTVTIGKGSILDVNCRDMLVRSGGTLRLDAAKLRDKKELTVEAGGIFTNTSGTIINCGEKSFYLVFPPEGNPAIVTFPKT
jgi:hypothetical protein